MSVVRGLNDHCFVLATESLRELSLAFEEELGRKPTLAELCEILTSGANTCSEDLTSDASNREISITGRVRAAKAARRALREGDVIAVPFGRNSRGLALYLGKYGRFGTAFGIFKGLAAEVDVEQGWSSPGVFDYPVFADPESVKTGRWAILGNRPDLIQRFRKPEIYHDPKDHQGDAGYGPYGLAESPSGIRSLDERESTAIFGQMRGYYRHAYLGDEFERFVGLLIAGNVGMHG